MDKAKAAVSQFTSGHGHHDTTIDESVSRPVTREEIKPTRKEEITQAVDREVHQDHYHTTIQPVQQQEVLPEKHSHVMGTVKEKHFEHGNNEKLRQRLDNEAAQFKDSSVTHETRHTVAAGHTVAGEHTHHHVHEKVQPIIQKETIAPEVVHTTVPIHETHHAGAQHHGVSALPMKTMDEFTSQGGGKILEGGKAGVAHEQYDGKPRAYNKDLETTVEEVLHPHGQSGAGSTRRV